MKTYKQFVVESDEAVSNLYEGLGGLFSGLRSVGRSAGRQWVKKGRPIEIITGLVGANRAWDGFNRPEGPGSYEAKIDYGLGAAAAMPFGGAIQNTLKLGALGIEGMRQWDMYQKYLKKKKEQEEKEKAKDPKD